MIDAPEREVVVEHLRRGSSADKLGSRGDTNPLGVLGIRDAGTREQDGLGPLHRNSNRGVHVLLCVALSKRQEWLGHACVMQGKRESSNKGSERCHAERTWSAGTHLAC